MTLRPGGARIIVEWGYDNHEIVLTPRNCVPLTGLQRVFGYVVTFDMRRLETWQAQRKKKDSTTAP